MKLSPSQLTAFQKFLGGFVFAAIIIFFIASRRQKEKWERLEEGLAESYGESAVPATDSPVYALDVEGDARFKRPAWLNWWPLKAGVELHPGDLVFASDDAKVVLFFLNQDSLVTLPEGTLFHVGLTVPQMSKLRTSGGVSSQLAKDAEKKVKDSATEARFSMRVVQNPTLQKDRTKAGDSNNRRLDSISDDELKIVRNTRVMPIRYPGPFVELYAEKFPTSIPVTFNLLPDSGQIWGYLWKGKELEPSWSSVGAAGFPTVPIEKPGLFVFQAMSDDELYASPPIVIHAIKRGEEDYFPHDERWFEGVRIFQ